MKGEVELLSSHTHKYTSMACGPRFKIQHQRVNIQNRHYVKAQNKSGGDAAVIRRASFSHPPFVKVQLWRLFIFKAPFSAIQKGTIQPRAS